MFSKNKNRRQIIIDCIFNEAFLGLNDEALLMRYPILNEWRDGIPLKQAKKIIHKVRKMCDDFKMILFLEKSEIITKRVSMMNLIKLLHNVTNGTYKIFI